MKFMSNYDFEHMGKANVVVYALRKITSHSPLDGSRDKTVGRFCKPQVKPGAT
jgi:hypothetical protein